MNTRAIAPAAMERIPARNTAGSSLPALAPEPVPASAIGSVAGLGSGEILLPDFVVQDAGGVQVNLAMMGGPLQMQRFVDRVFAAGAYFIDLDYAPFSRLLYPPATPGSGPTGTERATVRIAAAIAKFAPERRDLYKSGKSADKGARIEYVFSPAWLERIVDVPIYGAEDDAGQPVLTGCDRQIRHEATKLDADEFVAAMWSKGVRSGVDIDAVRAAISSGRDERIDIARRVDPSPGADATVQEQTSALHRDDSPSILPNGKVDLSHFKNHFPQVAAGTRLLQKQPRHLGVPGIDIDGSALEPDTPRDFELDVMAGPGTRIERTAKGEFLVAARDGFLNIDTRSHQISVTEKIVNRAGVSLRTTGNLLLVGDHYEEHGEVQEHRMVEGRHMNFHADVFGRIVSNGGEVHLHANLAGGSVIDFEGLVRIDGRASNSVLEARAGEVRAMYVENATVVAGKVKLGRAVNCDIVGEEVEIDEAIACTIAARSIRLASAGARRDAETLVTVCVPDFAALDRRRAVLAKEIDRLNRRIAAKQALLDERMANGEIRKYLAADQRIRSEDVKLTPAQEAQWRQAKQKLAGSVLEIQTLQKEMDTLNEGLGKQTEQLYALDTQRAQAAADIRCEIKRITGDVAVQVIETDPEAPVFAGIEATKVKHPLRDARAVRQRLFRGESGSFSWTWKPPTHN